MSTPEQTPESLYAWSGTREELSELFEIPWEDQSGEDPKSGLYLRRISNTVMIEYRHVSRMNGNSWDVYRDGSHLLYMNVAGTSTQDPDTFSLSIPGVHLLEHGQSDLDALRWDEVTEVIGRAASALSGIIPELPSANTEVLKIILFLASDQARSPVSNERE